MHQAGTRVDGKRIDKLVELHDGVRIELGNCVLVFRDPAERHLRGDPPAPTRVVPPEPEPPVPTSSPLPFVVAAAIAGLAAVGLVWILMS